VTMAINCENCGIRKRDPLATYCDCCQSMLDAVEVQPGLVHASLEWRRENNRRIKAKARILGVVEPKDQ
jgi:uncharacterized OB-fold protein